MKQITTEANNYASQEKKERSISLEESNQYTLSFEDSARQSEESHESSDYPQVASDYSTDCSETPSFESDAKSNELIGSPRGEALEIGDSGEEPERESDEGRGLDEFGFDKYDVDELAEYYDLSDDDYFAKRYLEQGLLDNIPIVKDIISAAKDERQADILFEAVLGVLSSIFPKCLVHDSYTERNNFINQMEAIIGEAASGKSVVEHVVNLTEDIQENSIRKLEDEWQRYYKDMSQYKQLEKKGKAPEEYPKEPSKVSTFRQVGTITNAAIIEWQRATDGEGLIYCSEMDELTKSMRNRFGAGSGNTIGRIATNEEIGSSNKPAGTARCKNPHASIVLCGHPSDVKGVFTNGEDGLFSRARVFRIANAGVFTSKRENGAARGMSIKEVTDKYRPWCTQVYNAQHCRDKYMLASFPPNFDDKCDEFFISRLLPAHQEANGSFFNMSITRYPLMVKRIATLFALLRPHETDWYATQDLIEVSIDDCRLAVRCVLDRHSSLLQIAHECYADKIGVGGYGSSNYPTESFSNCLKILNKLQNVFDTPAVREITDRPGEKEETNKVTCCRAIKDMIKYGLIEEIEKSEHKKYKKYRKVVQ